MLEGLALWLFEKLGWEFLARWFQPKPEKTVAQAEAQEFAKPAGTADDIIDRL